MCGCKITNTVPVIRNFTLRDDLKAGDTIVNRSGRSRFILKSATPQGDGSYRSIFLFWLEIWNLKIICEYWNLTVNTDNVIIRMGYESVYDPTFVADVDKIAEKINAMADAVATLTKDTRIRDTLKIKRPIDDIYVNGDGMPVING
ncbi:MAG: hypothetical protein LBL58_12880, partial [Tannerellaceae bacterium]|nr:hypothetical protein [Tannerellaceae bacterium]